MQENLISATNPKENIRAGKSYYLKGDFKQAKACFMPIVEHWRKQVAPDARSSLASALFNLGSTELLLHEFPDALAHLGEAVKCDAKNKKYRRRLNKAILYQLLSTKGIYRGGVREDILRQYTLFDWYRMNAKSLSAAFTKNFSDFVDLLKPLTHQQRYSIVSLGCGLGEEVYSLMNIVGEELWEKIHYTGIDPILSSNGQPDRIDIAKLYRTANYHNVLFYGCDARNKQVIDTIEKADLIILRHPVFNKNSSGAFQEILRTTIPTLSKRDGTTRVFITTYFADEMQLALKHLSNGSEINSEKYFPETQQCLCVIGDKTWYENGLIERNIAGEILYPDQYSFIAPCQPKKALALKKSEEKLEVKSEEKLPSSTQSKPVSVSLACSKRGIFATSVAITAVVIAAATTFLTNSSSHKP